jgi:cytochrome c-type biogenesis protein
MNQIHVGLAFIAGILSFLSPCVLPLIPGYISFLSGLSLEELQNTTQRGKILKKAGLTSILFVAGFSVVFVALGASASFVGKFLSAHMKILTRVAGILIVILGLYLLGVLKIGWLNVERRLKTKKLSPGLLGAFLMGLAFAFGWTPCIGPILAGILALAATQETVIKGVLLLAVYSMGLGIPFIITGFGVGIFIKCFQRYKRFIRWGEIFAGLLLVIMGVLIFFNNLTAVLRFVPSFFYKFAK